MEELKELKEQCQKFKLALCKSLKIDKFIKWLSKILEEIWKTK